MSRLSCCSSDHDDRIDMAAAYMLGLCIYFNSGEKSSKIMKHVQGIGFTQNESIEALQLLMSTNLVETKTKGCLSRKLGVKLSEYAHHISTHRLFEDLETVKKTSALNDAAEFLSDNASEIASAALAVGTLAV